MVCKEGSGGGPREAIPGGVMGGRRACVLRKVGGTNPTGHTNPTKRTAPAQSRSAIAVRARAVRTDRGALGRNACALRQGSAKFSSAVRTRWVGVSRWVGTSDLPTKRSQSAVEGGGERARGDQQGHWVTAALGVGVVVVACLSDPAGARGAPPRAISLSSPALAPYWHYWHPEIGDDVVRNSGDCGASPKSCRWYR